MRHRETHVHLGNIGHAKAKPHETETGIAAREKPHIHFIGIDHLKIEVPIEFHNWEQLQGDFVSGLERLEGNSIDVIESNAALFQFGKWEREKEARDKDVPGHGLNALRVALEKLKPGGEIIVVLPKFGIERAKKAFEQLPFSSVEIRPLTEEEAQKTRWRQVYIKGIKSQKWPHQIVGIK